MQTKKVESEPKKWALEGDSQNLQLEENNPITLTPNFNPFTSSYQDTVLHKVKNELVLFR